MTDKETIQFLIEENKRLWAIIKQMASRPYTIVMNTATVNGNNSTAVAGNNNQVSAGREIVVDPGKN